MPSRVLGDSSTRASHPAVTGLDVRVPVFLLTEIDQDLALNHAGLCAVEVCLGQVVITTSGGAEILLHTPTVMALVRQQRSPPVPPLAFWGALVLQTHSTQVPTTGEPVFAKQRKSTIQAQHPNHAMA